MSNYYKIEPNLSDDRVAYIDDWEFTYWPNKPQSEITQNPDGTFSVQMEENFTPLVTQLQNLFKNGNAPEDGTYIGEAVLIGKKKLADCIYGDFINSKRGLVISTRLLEIFRKFNLPEHSVYELPLVRKRKKFSDYSYLYFREKETDTDYDVRLIMDKYTPVVCVSEKIKEVICNSGIEGCEFTLINEST